MRLAKFITRVIITLATLLVGFVLGFMTHEKSTFHDTQGTPIELGTVSEQGMTAGGDGAIELIPPRTGVTMTDDDGALKPRFHIMSSLEYQHEPRLRVIRDSWTTKNECMLFLARNQGNGTTSTGSLDWQLVRSDVLCWDPAVRRVER